MSANTIDQLALYGPARCQAMSLPQARAWCARLARTHYENFSVLASVIPPDLRDDCAALYAFCRWADDLGDESQDPAHAARLLDWWRAELHLCFDGQPRHPVFIALHPAVRCHNLPFQPFDDLISAFQLDQRLTRYDTWDQLLEYCRLSANPVGRLVLGLFHELSGPDAAQKLAASDQICTALQLTNHVQDLRRDLLDRDRIYLPRDLCPIADFERRFAASARLGFAVDHQFLAESRAAVKTCVDRTWLLFEQGATLLRMLGPRARPFIWLLAAGGTRVLHLIELWNYETVLHRPTLGKISRAVLLSRAWFARIGLWPIRMPAT